MDKLKERLTRAKTYGGSESHSLESMVKESMYLAWPGSGFAEAEKPQQQVQHQSSGEERTRKRLLHHSTVDVVCEEICDSDDEDDG